MNISNSNCKWRLRGALNTGTYKKYNYNYNSMFSLIPYNFAPVVPKLVILKLDSAASNTYVMLKHNKHLKMLSG